MSIEDLEDITKVQCSDGNWNHDAYMHGMANGMILALATVKGSTECPEFLEAPNVWLEDIPSTLEKSCESEEGKK